MEGKMNQKEYRELYESKAFAETYLYEGNDLGARCKENSTVFKLWSPLAVCVQLNLYKDCESPAFLSVAMKKEEKGVWSHLEPKNCHGVFYDFSVTENNETRTTPDPYARSCGCNGTRSMAVDLDKTNPDGWELDQPPKASAEQVIYEIHVKDFSHDPASGVREDYRGRYKAFTLTGTTLNDQGEKPTCLDYLKQLGVTHVQLLPVYDFGSVDEAGGDDQFNWGYDPQNYNVPEGSYATDTTDGVTRIRELKELILTLHQNGIGVIMDVVYNHTYRRDYCFDLAVPNYYYRQFEDGRGTNGSACGNDMASDREMCANYIYDSLMYWAKEYHMDGFRFDLMGLLDTDLMNRIREGMDREFGKGTILLYGEPWTAGESPLRDGKHPSVKTNLDRLDEGIGVFCDTIRDAVKGHVFEETVPGFVNGGKGLDTQILKAARGFAPAETSFPVKSPNQLITYVSAHDNLTLWDKLMITMRPGKEFDRRWDDVVRANRMAAAICFTCQGRLFFQAGEEAARTKHGDENSYRSSVAVNRIDWNRVYEYEDLTAYYRGLIAFRKQMPGLCDKTKDAQKRILEEKNPVSGVVWFCVDNREHPEWDRLLVCCNSTDKPFSIDLPQNVWELLVDGENSGLWKDAKQVTASTVVERVSVSVFGRKRI
ncbi:MAG: type I pullulanase [Lachnospiraceae bacterium]|nr:type I pullulanase [Lachnospiraceae bacterium]